MSCIVKSNAVPLVYRNSRRLLHHSSLGGEKGKSSKIYNFFFNYTTTVGIINAFI